jgi:glycosyltransferase involved in cell wall biosynthesis
MNRSLDLVLPVYNESKSLLSNFKKLYNFMELHVSRDWIITIAENGSSDNTLDIAKKIQRKYKKSRVISNENPGKGLALKNAWLSSNAEIFAYMDLDLSTDIEIIPEFLNKIDDGQDFVIGSRLIKGSRVIGRSLKREIISRSYSKIFRFFLSVNFYDAQCGFKFVKKEAALKILDDCKDEGWFFDTEILYKAEKNNLSICELPVTWIDDPDTKVNIISTIIKDLIGLVRLRLEKNG